LPPINFIEHALDRMKERGILDSEVRKTINIGKMTPAKNGRIKYSMTFNVSDSEKRKLYSKKTVIVIAEKVKNEIDVISVLAKYS